jgi:hypothetical protein
VALLAGVFLLELQALLGLLLILLFLLFRVFSFKPPQYNPHHPVAKEDDDRPHKVTYDASNIHCFQFLVNMRIIPCRDF